MAERDERLTPATRNYVIFGLLFVLAIGLAIFECVDPRERRGESDSALRLLVVSSDVAGPASALADLDGFNVAQLGPFEAIAAGRELSDEEDEPAYRAAITYADQLGYGFIALDLREHDWGLEAGSPGVEEAPPESARFAVFSVGDVASDGPRMHAVGLPEGMEIDPRVAELDSVRLGLFEHPDFLRLWTIEPNASELQARRVFDSRKIDDRRALLRRDHEDWRSLADAWPGPERMAGSLAGAWERAQAAPIPGGLLLEVRALRIHIDAYRRARLELDDQATLAFLPTAALGDDDPERRQAARRPCTGLPERVSTQVAVAPDGAAVVIAGADGTSELFVFEQAADAHECRARSVGSLAIGERAVGRPHARGAMAWTYDDDWVHWWDTHGEHRVRVEAAEAYSGPWWVDADLLALIGERTLVQPVESEDFPALGYEPALVLLSTTPEREHEPPLRIELGARELFAIEDTAEPPALLDLRPAGPDALLLTSERCPAAALDDPSPCLHRLRAAPSLAAIVPELARRPLTELLEVETLGPLDPHVELAVAADGSRVAWIDRDTRSLKVADLRGPQRMIPRRLDQEDTPDASLRISPDGRTVLSEVHIEFILREREVGSVQVPRAYELDPLPPEGS